MLGHRPQFYKNTLDLPQINGPTLQQALQDLRDAVLNGVKIIESDDPPRAQYDGRGLFNGELGIALAYLRLAHQTPSLSENRDLLPPFYDLASARIPNHGPDLPLQIGRLSPLSSNSPVTAAVLRILSKAATNKESTISDSDITCLNDAVALALSHGPIAFYHGHNLGADEILFGRAGLLWAILNIRARMTEFSPAEGKLLTSIVEAVPELVRVIIDAGRQGAAVYVEKHGLHGALPLMWTWMQGHYGIGVAHGLTGIIPVLLACYPEEISDYLPEIGTTITNLCKICIAHDGHMPTCIPPRSSSSSRESPLVQICHGAPAILALLGCAMKNTNLLLHHWTPDWDKAVRIATDRVWEEGLLSKGGSLCHGIAGNAWPFLLLHDVFGYKQEILQKARENYTARTMSRPDIAERTPPGDYFLSRAIAMLLHARETRPYHQSPETATHDYRMPDYPYCLFEGLAGTVCAWAEACVVIRTRLRSMEIGANTEVDAVFQECMQQQLGFPCLGGNGVTGVL